MTTKQTTIIATGASQGIGAAVANLFLDRGYNVVGNSRKINHRNELQRSDRLALVEGDIGLTAAALPADATSRKQAKMMKNVRLVEFKGGPHGVLWTHAEQISSELVKFLA